MKVLHLITGLGTGGAETMLLKLLSRFHVTGGPDAEVICLAAEGPLAAPIREMGIPVTSLGMLPGIAAFLKFPRLRSLIRAARPDIVQSWMYHANLMAGLAVGGPSGPPLIWGLRQSNLDRARSKRLTVAVAQAGARFSRRWPERILCVSGSVRDVHVAMGYDAAKSIVIANGFDLDCFKPDVAARNRIRAELGIADDDPVIGLVARFDPQKDHRTFFTAARKVAAAHPDCSFVLCGDGVEPGTPALAELAEVARFAGRLHLLGSRPDIAEVTAAFDIAVSSSAFGEGFSNALGEALCSGVPVVATEVGEARSIIGDSGIIVPPEDGAALARALERLLAMPPEARRAMGEAGRSRMARDYRIGAIAGRYLGLYEEVLARRGKLS